MGRRGCGFDRGQRSGVRGQESVGYVIGASVRDIEQRDDGSYGWLMVVMAAIAMVATLPGRTHGLGMITERLLTDGRLGIDRVEFGRMNFWATLIGALFCLASGPLIDRYGSRRVMTGVVLLLGVTVLTMCRATGSLSFFLLLTLTRGFGQSALSVVSLALVGKWFRQRLGLAMGVYSVFVAFGFMTAFGIFQNFHQLPWTTVWASLGWSLIIVVAPLSWLLVRDGPPRGVHADLEPNSTQSGASQVADWTLLEALSTPSFWVFGLATSIYGLIAAGTSLFNESLLTERGFPRDAFYEVAIIGAFVGMAFNFVGGWLARGRWLNATTACALVVLGTSLALLPRVTERWQLVAYAVGLGASGGVVTVVFFTVWGRLYGQAHLGRIQGVAQMLTVFASALGPELMARWHARTGSYVGLLYWLAAAVGMLCLAVVVSPLPRKTSAPIESSRFVPEPIPAGE
jgi:MFS family permease